MKLIKDMEVLPTTLCKSPALCVLILRSEMVAWSLLLVSRTLKWVRSVLMRPCIVPLIGREICMTLFYILGTGEVRDSWSFLSQRDNLI